MISALRIANFKGFASLNLDLRNLTLLSGINGTGKSSVLQALLLLRQSWQQGLLANGRLALNGELVQIGTAQDALYGYASDDNIAFGISEDNAGLLDWKFAYDRDADVLSASPADKGDNASLLSVGLFSDRFHYVCAERTGPRTAFATSDYSVRQQRQLGVRGEFAAQYLSVYGSAPIALESAVHPNSKQRDLLSQVEAWLGDISPGARLSITSHQSLDLVQLQYRFETGSELTDSYRSTNVGFGITYALSILTAVLSATPGTLLLLENPEAHLHPRGQLRIGELLAAAASDGVQIIVETHSDHLMNGVRLAVRGERLSPNQLAIHFFSRVESAEQATLKATSPQIDRDGRLSNWPEGFFDQWEVALARLVKPRRS